MVQHADKGEGQNEGRESGPLVSVAPKHDHERSCNRRADEEKPDGDMEEFYRSVVRIVSHRLWPPRQGDAHSASLEVNARDCEPRKSEEQS